MRGARSEGEGWKGWVLAVECQKHWNCLPEAIYILVGEERRRRNEQADGAVLTEDGKRFLLYQKGNLKS